TAGGAATWSKPSSAVLLSAWGCTPRSSPRTVRYRSPSRAEEPTSRISPRPATMDLTSTRSGRRCTTPTGSTTCSSADAQERGDRRLRLQRRQFVRGGQLRPVAQRVHHAQEAKRLALCRAELVPGPGRDGDQVERPHRPHLVAHQAL